MTPGWPHPNHGWSRPHRRTSCSIRSWSWCLAGRSSFVMCTCGTAGHRTWRTRRATSRPSGSFTQASSGRGSTALVATSVTGSIANFSGTTRTHSCTGRCSFCGLLLRNLEDTQCNSMCKLLWSSCRTVCRWLHVWFYRWIMSGHVRISK